MAQVRFLNLKFLHELAATNDRKFKFTALRAKRGSTMDGAPVLPRRNPRRNPRHNSRRTAWVAGVAAVITAFMAAFPEAAQSQVPTINIQETCQAAAGVMINLSIGGGTAVNDVQICLDSENKAREQLVKDWSTFASSDREGCIQTNVYLPSYIEWVTCFEMNKVVREARQQGRAVSSLTNADGSVTLPPVSKLGINMRGYRGYRY